MPHESKYGGGAVMTGTNALLEAVEGNVRRAPGAPVFAEGETGRVTSYQELWDAARRLAAGLAARVAGRGPVLVLGHKEALTVEAFLGCLMSGHAYVPVDVELPPERVRSIAGQIPGAVLLATCPVRESWPGCSPAAPCSTRAPCSRMGGRRRTETRGCPGRRPST